MKQHAESVSKKQVPMDVYSTDKNFTGNKPAGQSDTFSREMKDDLQDKINKAIDEVKIPTSGSIKYMIARVIRELK